MRITILLAVALASLALAGSAAQASWYMSYGQAKNETKRFSKAFCEEDPECVGWGVGKCFRRSSARFTCFMASFYRSFYELGDEVECNTALHWGAGRGGYIELKNYGKPHCFPLA